jgi:hypothetical protein
MKDTTKTKADVLKSNLLQMYQMISIITKYLITSFSGIR